LTGRASSLRETRGALFDLINKAGEEKKRAPQRWQRKTLTFKKRSTSLSVHPRRRDR
jgi:hypothetical protein